MGTTFCVRRDSEIATDPTLANEKDIPLHCFACQCCIISFNLARLSALSMLVYLPIVQAGLKTENENSNRRRERANVRQWKPLAQTKTQVFKNAAPDYIKRYAAVAVQEMNAYGIPASISLAQGLIKPGRYQ